MSCESKVSSWDHMRYHTGTLAPDEKVEQPSAAVDPAAGRRVCVLTLALPWRKSLLVPAFASDDGVVEAAYPASMRSREDG